MTHLAARLTRDRTPVRRVHWRRWALWALMILMVVGGYLLWQVLRPVSVDATQVIYQRVGPVANPLLRQSGYVTYPRTVTVATTVRTPVVARPVGEGDRVQAGAVLARFDDRELAAQAQIQEVTLGDARTTLDRTERRHAAGTVSDAALQQARTAVEQAQAALALTQMQIGQTVVLAPFAGLVTETLVEVGEFATNGVCLLVDDQSTLVEVDVSQIDMGQIGSDQPAVVTLDAYPDVEYAARLFAIRPQADPAKNTVQMRVEVLQPDDRFQPDLSAKVYFVDAPVAENAPVQAVLAVDTSAVVQQDGATYVWRIEEGQVHRRAIQTGSAMEGMVEVRSGVQENDQVVAHARAVSLEDGERVTVQ